MDPIAQLPQMCHGLFLMKQMLITDLFMEIYHQIFLLINYKTNDSSTFYWVGTLANSYTPNINSAPKITISFDVANQLRSQQAGVDTCYMYVLPPTVSVSLTD